MHPITHPRQIPRSPLKSPEKKKEVKTVRPNEHKAAPGVITRVQKAEKKELKI